MEDDLDPAFKAILELRTYTPDSNVDDDSPALQKFQQETQQIKQVEDNINKTIESALGVVRDSLQNNKPVKPPAPKPGKYAMPRYTQQKSHGTASHFTPYVKQSIPSIHHPSAVPHQNYHMVQAPSGHGQYPQHYPQAQVTGQCPQPYSEGARQYPQAPEQYSQLPPQASKQYFQHYPHITEQHQQYYSPSYPYFPEAIPEEHSPVSTVTIGPSPSEVLKVRSELMAVPLPSLPPGLSEDELLGQARERQLLLNTHDTTSGLFGHDPIFARESRAQFYESCNNMKKRQEEEERLELRQKYEEGVRQRQLKEMQKLEKRKQYLMQQQQRKQQQAQSSKPSESDIVASSVLSRLPPELIETLEAMDTALNKHTTTINMPPMNAWQEFLRLKQSHTNSNSSGKTNKKKKVKPPGAHKRSYRPPHRGRVVK